MTVKTTLYLTAKVLPGNKIEIQAPSLSVGQTVEVVILVQEVNLPSTAIEKQTLSLEQRLAFLKLPIAERKRVLENQSEKMLSHYQQDSEYHDEC